MDYIFFVVILGIMLSNILQFREVGASVLNHRPSTDRHFPQFHTVKLISRLVSVTSISLRWRVNLCGTRV